MNVTMTGPNAANHWQPQVRNYEPPQQNGAPQQTDGYTSGGGRSTVDTISRYTALGATALTVTALCGASDAVLQAIGVPVALGGLAAVALTFVNKDNSFGALKAGGNKTDMAARITAFSMAATGISAALGGGDAATGLVALPGLLGGPTTAVMWALEKRGQSKIPQAWQPPQGPAQQPQQPTWAPPQQVQGQPPTWAPPQGQWQPPAQFGTNQPAPPQVGSNQGAPVQFGAGDARPQQQQAQPPVTF